MTITLAKRTHTEISSIRKIFQQLDEINRRRRTLNLEPVIDLSIGQPHIPVNPRTIAHLRESLENGEISYQFGYSQEKVSRINLTLASDSPIRRWQMSN